ncbi:acetolactate synthase large subunit [Methanosarcina mazei]|jgi:acetolactate synthase-1/2/3 large subunit|uniref:Acetolactate synthase n=4 Tax=Methanosarcina mazei TaxID=2209 RepID=A0A0F8KFP4_METMZ|nr:acetolactate synthase large subunit [Methanosarcina mazei]AAM30366.1 Acetolactate synthase large subunit [Methanosarcina mazei Go1]AKB39638.1 Acetolactate synthase large subunit [Methanosarcina mazei WWM610]AKB63839.1 Acetolactate synthase large subunit [Methanosarcina mazei S-6]KKF97923.1 acetolactate synthase catalytic subunit [Methanosarcina mazei]KKG00991.1 acetolactate synthase catalytic subunit [Methanosarcina mazei]
MTTGSTDKVNGAKALIKCLEKEGVDTLFGYPGGQIIPFYNELYDSDLRHILVRHEQAAAHAADGYARATGKTGVCVSTSGPGATNLVTGIATAYMDSVPIVALTGQVPRSLIGNDAFQEADITGITMPITKHNYLVQDPQEIPRIVKEAFHIASTGRPGPVLIDLPKDVQNIEIDLHYPERVELRGYKPTYKGNTQQIKRAAEEIANSCRPIIYAGGGVISSNASAELVEFAETIKAPVTTTLMGISSIPTEHPLYVGMLGMHGCKYANYAIQESDLIIAVGARFDDRVTGKLESFAPNARVIHIDVDPAEISKNVKVHIPIVGDAKQVLKSLIRYVQCCRSAEWIEKVNLWKKEYPLNYRECRDTIMPQFVIEQISEVCRDAIIVTEVGQHQMWAAQFFKYSKPRTFLTSGGLGTMGYGFPAAMGAKVGRPDKTVINIAGDGSFQMNSQELATVVQNDIPVVSVILNNGYLGMVRQWQELFYDRRYSYTFIKGSVDFVKLAEAYGALGLRAERPSEVRPAIEEAVNSGRPTVVEVIVECEANVYPMVPAGAAINEIIDLEEHR